MKAILLGIALLSTVARGGDYAVTPGILDAGGLTGSSASYSLTASAGAGQAGQSASYTSRSGYAGQLSSLCGLYLAALPDTVAEGGTRQLSAWQVSDDDVYTPLAAGDVTWSVDSGPVAGISSAGLVTAASVFENTTATIRGTSGGCVDVLPLTVEDVLRDNFGTYAGDGLPDSWQVQYFGVGAPNGGQQQDYDQDSVENLLEFAFGTHPASGSSGLQNLQYAGTLAGGGTLVATGLPITMVEPVPTGVDFRVLFSRRTDWAAVGLVYTPQFSVDLLEWVSGTSPVTVLAHDGVHEIASMKYLNFIRGKKTRFFRLRVTLTP